MSKLREMREENGIKQEDMAEFLNISPSSYSKKECGMIRFSLSEARELAEYFGRSIEDIFSAYEVSR